MFPFLRFCGFALVPLCVVSTAGVAEMPTVDQPVLGHRTVALLQRDGLTFKDLNRNGQLDPYEDWRLSPQERADDLVRRMQLADLAGLMVHGTLPAAGGAEAAIGRGSGYDLPKVRGLVATKRINSFITRLGGDPAALATANNEVQALAETTGLGVPVTVSTDPRNSFEYTAGASNDAGSFSKWPENTGFAAINDPELTRRYADTVRREYVATGMREALSPQADLATEPRWPRINGTFGEDATIAEAQVKAYIEGIQGGDDGLHAGSVMGVVKHWVGYGAQKDGLDSHNYYGRYSALTNAQLSYHIQPFLGAFQAHVAAVMPMYSILEDVTLDGRPLEPVGAGYSKELLTTLLRGKYGFNGVVLSDWAITNDCNQDCRDGAPAGQQPGVDQISTGWGVMELTRAQRFAKAINAGVDQVGGTEDVEALLAAEASGALTEARMREAARRILVQKFAIGLFENPYVDPAAAARVVGDPAAIRAGMDAQKRAMVLLERRAGVMPVKPGTRVWLFHVSPEVAAAHGLVVVKTPAEAQVALLRGETPHELLHPNYFFGLRQHEGRLDLRAGDPAYDALVSCGKTPAILTVSLDRPAILTNVKNKAAVLYGDFGVSDEALVELVMGQGRAEGHLPFELPSSMEAVRAQVSGVAHDSAKPLYPFGYAFGK